MLREGRDGTIWAGTSNGLYRLEHANGRRSLRPIDVHIPTEFPEQRIIADVLEDARGSLWIAAPSGLYRRWPDGSAARYTMRDGLPNEYLQDLLEDHEGRLWAGTRLGGFFRFSADDTRQGRRWSTSGSTTAIDTNTVCRPPGCFNSSRRPTVDSGSRPQEVWWSSSRLPMNRAAFVPMTKERLE